MQEKSPSTFGKSSQNGSRANPYDYGHWRACPGIEQSSTWVQIGAERKKINQDVFPRGHFCTLVDMAWMLCLLEAEIIPMEKGAKVLEALKAQFDEGNAGWGGELAIMERLDHDEDLGSLINLGRTLQEPMARMNMRDRIIDLEPHLISLLEALADHIDKNDDAIMPGHTHWSQANPITLASFYLSVFDETYRAITLLEHAYRDVNSNTGGCGATSGISWPVDRQLLTDLLGFDSLMESTYAGEASQDQSMTLMYALSNLGILISRVTTTMQAWALEEIGFLKIRPDWAGVSSYMPQKAHPGAVTEVARMMATDTISQMLRGLLYSKNEFYGDVLPAMEMGQSIPPTALNNTSVAVQMFREAVKNLEPQKDRMLKTTIEGFSCATEVVVHMVKELGYGGRRAHRITANFIRMAREKELAANECTGELLDEAALHVEDRPPEIDTATLRKLLDPREFLKTHNNIGGIAPEETQRLLKERRTWIADYKRRAEQRRDKRDAALATLREKVDAAILDYSPIETV